MLSGSSGLYKDTCTGFAHGTITAIMIPQAVGLLAFFVAGDGVAFFAGRKKTKNVCVILTGDVFSKPMV
jgi:hypothetical protein